MELLQCSTCGNQLREDLLATVNSYDNEVGLLFNTKGIVDYTTLPSYIVFVCHRCGFSKSISIMELYNVKQKTIIEVLLRKRLDRGMTSVKGVSIAEQNGVVYCGFCSGPLDGDGYCYADVISKCIIRSSFVDKI